MGWIPGPFILDESQLNTDMAEASGVKRKKAGTKKKKDDVVSWSYMVSVPLLNKSWAKKLEPQTWKALEAWNGLHLRRSADDKAYVARSKLFADWAKSIN